MSSSVSVEGSGGSSHQTSSDRLSSLRAPARVQHHAQDAVAAEPGVPEAGVGHSFPSGPECWEAKAAQIIASALVRGLIRSSEERIAPRVEFRRRELTLSPCRLWH